MTKFSLKAGKAFSYSFDLESSHVDRWISFPLTRTVKEIDLCVHVKQPGKLPPQLFSLGMAEVLKIDSNLQLENPVSFALVSVRVLCLKTRAIPDIDFLADLQSGCPSLLELQVSCCECPKLSPVLKISHPFLQRLTFYVPPIETFKCQKGINVRSPYLRTDLILDTPNLQYLDFADDLALRYSAGNLNALVEAHIDITGRSEQDDTYFQSMLSLLSLLAKIHSLSLCDSAYPDGEAFQLKEELMLVNLKDLKLYIYDFSYCFVLLDLLHCTPILETLTFPIGNGIKDEYETTDGNVYARLVTELENTDYIPSCLRSRLKKIVIETLKVSEEEFSVLKYFLRNGAVSQEVDVRLDVAYSPGVDVIQIEIALNNLPRKSANCSTKVHSTSSRSTGPVIAL